MSRGAFHRGWLIVAAVAACGAGLVSRPGLWPGSAAMDTVGLVSMARAAAGSAASPLARPLAHTGVADCTAASLRLTVTGLGVAAGSSYYSINLTNMSGRRCALEGYPRVSFVSAPDGHQLGAAAGHDPVYPGRRVILRPGHDAYARLQAGASGNYPAPACHPVMVRWLRVYPPAAAAPLYAGFAGSACTVAAARLLSISRIQPGWGAYVGGRDPSASRGSRLRGVRPGVVRISASAWRIPPVTFHITVPVRRRPGPLVPLRRDAGPRRSRQSRDSLKAGNPAKGLTS